MKKLVLAVCAVMLVVLLVTGGGKKAADGTSPEILSVSEAAFSIRNSESVDATSFLVGRYTKENGERLSFDGQGEVRKIAVNLVTEVGSCTLMQTDSGAAILRMDMDNGVELYSFKILSPEGGFVLTDEDGNTQTYTPVV